MPLEADAILSLRSVDAVAQPNTQADAASAGWLLGTPLGGGAGALVLSACDCIISHQSADAIAQVAA